VAHTNYSQFEMGCQQNKRIFLCLSSKHIFAFQKELKKTTRRMEENSELEKNDTCNVKLFAVLTCFLESFKSFLKV
jgi:hypothetical protein